MMKYRAVIDFVDTQDNNHVYKIGDEFPRLGMEVTDARIDELIGSNNKLKRSVIEAYLDDNLVQSTNIPNENTEEEEIPFEPKRFTAKQLKAMTIDQIDALAEEYGYTIDATLKADIIAEFLKQQG